MLIGIVADIHDAVGPLATALARLRERGAERIVTLGDAFESFEAGSPGAQVARLLQGVGAIGVWGNHDYGLSYEAPAEVRERADPDLLRFASGLLPQIVVEGSRFCHIEPWKNPCELVDLWSFEGVPDTSERAEHSFGAVPERTIFLGHFHCALVVSRNGRMDWKGTDSIRLSQPDRYLVVVPAVVDGWCATFDTARSELVAIPCGEVPPASS